MCIPVHSQHLWQQRCFFRASIGVWQNVFPEFIDSQLQTAVRIVHLMLIIHSMSARIKAIFGASLSEPHIDKFAVEFVYIYIYVVRCVVSHFQLLFYAFLHHSLIQKLFTNYSYSARRHQPSIFSIATASTVDLSIQWIEQYVLPHGKKVSSVDAIICVANQWKSLLTWTDLSNGHIDEGYCMS